MQSRHALLAAMAMLAFSGTAAGAAPLHAERNVRATAQARAACRSDDFDMFLIHLAKASPAEQRRFFAPRIKLTVQDTRHAGPERITVRHVAGVRFAGFPLAMMNHHFVHAQSGVPSRSVDGSPEFLEVTSERQTAILTDYPVAIVNVSWRKIRYAPPAPGQAEGTISGAYGDSGRMLFVRGPDDCWQLIDSFTTRASDALRSDR